MRVALLCSPAARRTADWVTVALADHGHDVTAAVTVTDVRTAGPQGHLTGDAWRTAGVPDVALALGWEAGLAAQVAARDRGVPVVLRLTRVGREPAGDRARLETALARDSALVLVPSAGERDRLAERGVPRDRLRVVAEAVDPARFLDSGVAAGGAGRRVVVARPALADLPDEVLAAQLREYDVLVVGDDSEAEVALTLRAMACGVPVVAVDRGVLSDVVADGVTGLLTRPDLLAAAVNALLADPTRRETMGLAAVDRIRARFTPTVVGEALERALQEVGPDADMARGGGHAHGPEVARAS